MHELTVLPVETRLGLKCYQYEDQLILHHIMYYELALTPQKAQTKRIALPKRDLGYNCDIILHMEAIIDDSYKNYHLTRLLLFILLMLRMSQFFQVFCHNIVIKVKFKRLVVIYW